MRTAWHESHVLRSPTLPPLDRDWQADVAIAGGGITGLTLARQLAAEGLRVVVLERARIGSGTTGATTAHLTAALDIDYRTLLSRFGEASARLVIESVNESIDRIEKVAGSLEWDCGFARVPGYQFTEDRADLRALEQEAEVGRRLGVDVRSIGDGTRILAGGEDHSTGREDDTAARHHALEQWVRAHFPVRSIEQRWSHELFEPADGLPYVGALGAGGSQLVAAGFSGTGMTFGSMAAGLLFDLVVRGSSPWKDVYAASRLKPLAAG